MEKNFIVRAVRGLTLGGLISSAINYFHIRSEGPSVSAIAWGFIVIGWAIAFSINCGDE